VAVREGRNNEAEALLRESLEYAQALVDKEIAIGCLRELAALTLSKGDAERAARLAGAIETLHEEAGHVPQPDDRRLNEQIASQLDEEHLAAARAEGQAMTLDEAVVCALEPLE
jgi:hypothetical protein